MTINPKRIFLLAMVAASATLLACNSGSSGGSSSSGGETGQVSLAVTDAPVDDAVEVVVRFTHVELQPADGDRVRIDFDLRTSIRPSEFDGYHRLRRALRVVDNS